jgi:hypothetical protein
MYELVMSYADASTHNGEEPAVTSEPRILPSFIQSLKKNSASIDAGVVGSTGIAKLQCFGDWIISTPCSSGQSELSRDFHRVPFEAGISYVTVSMSRILGFAWRRV